MPAGLGTGNAVGLGLQWLFDLLGQKEEEKYVNQANIRNEQDYQKGLALLSGASSGYTGQAEALRDSVLGGYGRNIDQLAAELGGITGDYGARTGTAMGMVDQIGASEREDIIRRRRAMQSEGEANLRRRGLGSSYLTNANAAQAAEYERRGLLDLTDRLGQLRLGTYGTFSGQELGAREQAALTLAKEREAKSMAEAELGKLPINIGLGTTGAIADWISNRRDTIMPTNIWRNLQGTLTNMQNARSQSTPEANTTLADTGSFASGLGSLALGLAAL